LSQTGVLSDAENYRLGHGNLPEWQRKIPHATVVALAHAPCAVSWSRKRDRRTRRKHSVVGGHAVGCDTLARPAGLSRCAGVLPRAGVPRVMRGKPAPPACEVRAFSSLRLRTAISRQRPVRHTLSYTADRAVRGRRSPRRGDWARCKTRPKCAHARPSVLWTPDRESRIHPDGICYREKM